MRLFLKRSFWVKCFSSLPVAVSMMLMVLLPRWEAKASTLVSPEMVAGRPPLPRKLRGSASLKRTVLVSLPVAASISCTLPPPANRRVLPSVLKPSSSRPPWRKRAVPRRARAPSGSGSPS